MLLREPQDDIMHSDLTVDENLWLNANIRLPHGLRRQDKLVQTHTQYPLKYSVLVMLLLERTCSFLHRRPSP